MTHEPASKKYGVARDGTKSPPDLSAGGAAPDGVESVGLSKLPHVGDLYSQATHATNHLSVRSDDAPTSQDAPTAVPKLPARLGRFQIVGLLGQGAFGCVYRAHDSQLDREVALKVPIVQTFATRKVQRFLLEAKSAARLRHPSIVPTYDSGCVDGHYFIASQFVQGQPLSTRLRENPPDFRQAAEWVRQLAEALAYAHKQGIVHRDIKPDNVMLDEQSVPQIMDFGLAKRLNDDAAMTTDGSILGTPAYMPPEQARGQLELVGTRSDQYSLGVVLYELLTRKRPFEGPSHTVISQVIRIEPPAPRSLRPDVPKDLEAICHKAMSKEPDSRYLTCSEMADDLARWLRGEVTLARPVGLAERWGRWCRRNPVVSGLTAAVAMVMLVGFIAVSAALWLAEKNLSLANVERANAAENLREARRQEEIAKEQKLAAERNLQLANQRKSEAEAAQKAASERADELAKTLSELDRTKGQVSGALEAAKKSAYETLKSGYRARIAEAGRLLDDRQYAEALQRLLLCPAELRDPTWHALHDRAKGQHFRVVPLDPSVATGHVYFPPLKNLAVVDGDKALMVIKLDDGTVMLQAKHPAYLNHDDHITFFMGQLVVLVYADHVRTCDLEAMKLNPAFSIPTSYVGRGYRFAQDTIIPYGVSLVSKSDRASQGTPHRASRSKPPVMNLADIVKRNLGPQKSAEDSDAPKMSQAESPKTNPEPPQSDEDAEPQIACLLFDKQVTRSSASRSLGEGWQIGIAKGFRQRFSSEYAPIAVDFYGPNAIFQLESWFLEKRFDDRTAATNPRSYSMLPKMEPAIGSTHHISLVSETLAVLSKDDKLAVWGLRNNVRQISEFPVPPNSISMMALSADGAVLATYGTGENAAVTIREAATGKIIRVFANQSGVRNLGFDRGLEVRPGRFVPLGTPHSPKLGWVSREGLCIWELPLPAPAESAAGTQSRRATE